MIFSKIKDAFASKIANVFKPNVDLDIILDEIEEVLIFSDVGVKTSSEIISNVRQKLITRKEQRTDKEHIISILKEEMIEILSKPNKQENIEKEKKVILVVGVNGVGKTTSIAKLAKLAKDENKKVLLAAGDTFRAGAIEQLEIWAKLVGVKCITKPEFSDPASVIFDAVSEFKAGSYDVLICDSAGRMHNKKNLMDEIEKIKKTITKNVTEGTIIEVLMVIDATCGQNAVEQVKAFFDKTNIDGIILTKLDSTAKGGIVFSIINEINVPICYIGIGERIEDMKIFNPKDFIDSII